MKIFNFRIFHKILRHQPENATVIVVVKGSVAKLGTYSFPAKARVKDALVAAGGFGFFLIIER